MSHSWVFTQDKSKHIPTQRPVCKSLQNLYSCLPKRVTSHIFTMNEWIGKQIGIHLYKGTLLSNKMEKITDAHSHINESEKHHTKWKSSTHKGFILNNFAEAKGPKPVLGTEGGDCIHRSTSSVHVVKEMPCVFHLWWLVGCVLFVRSYEL